MPGAASAPDDALEGAGAGPDSAFDSRCIANDAALAGSGEPETATERETMGGSPPPADLAADAAIGGAAAHPPGSLSEAEWPGRVESVSRCAEDEGRVRVANAHDDESPEAADTLDRERAAPEPAARPRGLR